MNQSKKDKFIELVRQHAEQETMGSLTLVNRRDGTQDIKKAIIRLVNLKAGKRLSFTYRYPTNDITKNYPIPAAIEIISELLEKNFTQAELFTSDKKWFLSYPTKGKTKLTDKSVQEYSAINLSHDKNKNRPISGNSAYLNLLGITNDDGKVLKDKQAKYRQINKFIEIIDPIISKAGMDQTYSVVDMGSGKGYLTFALYDHLKNNKNHEPRITGIEIREDLVNKCNAISDSVGFDKLQFKEGSIQNTSVDKMDVLIALHACNTATDDAIAKGILAGAKIIICSPCCHKQIRKQMDTSGPLKNITQYGILKERQAEILTDTIRALYLKAYGYQTNVMEFISTEHTPKNLLIVGTKKESASTPDKNVLSEITELKKMYGIEYHHLERLLGD